ncbi:MAG: hypothetical protein HUJ52_03835 [Malacoplasma sp.]|nr:hypothetical protein [Malacoplasma sp.]
MSKQDPVLIFNKGYKELKTLMPKAKIVVFNNSKHMLFEEEPTKFVKVGKQFLK